MPAMPGPDFRHRCDVVHPELAVDHGGHPASECLICNRRSAHPEDLRQGWCAACNRYTARSLLRRLGLPLLTLDQVRTQTARSTSC